MFVKIKNIIVLEDSMIKFFFDDGEVRILDFKPIINKKGVLNKPLANLKYFKTVKIYEEGHGIFWPNDLDFSADYLHYCSKPEKVTA